MTFLIAIAGGVGAATRLILGGWIRSPGSGRFPWSTAVINVSGAFLLGIVATADPNWRSIAGVGFLGGYTTFSTASFETARLAHDSRYGAAFANGLGMLVLAVAAAALGYWVGSAN